MVDCYTLIVTQVHAKLHKTCSFLNAPYTEIEKFVKNLFYGENTHLLNGHML